MENLILKSKNSDKEYPSHIGKKWSDEEETLLLEELNKNMDIELIAKTHNRTTGGIYSRRNLIAYRMYTSNISIKEIIMKTKLDEDKIIEIINKNKNKKNTNEFKTIIENKKVFSIEIEIDEIKNDIKELKSTIKELVEMMKAVYEFEDT